MPFQAFVIFEALFTLRTLVRPLSSVNSDVNPKISFNCEALSTLLTGERSLSRVNSHVAIRSSFLCKTSPALLT